ncbi:hypothetical protein BaRGS_00033618 [Batillaria attramentaria]|uniref:Uncharacterized protein n=1 Tax=Batillaria attramentaria TaxID=370345 RepID=A0ABD0JKF0_9CAEN
MAQHLLLMEATGCVFRHRTNSSARLQRQPDAQLRLQSRIPQTGAKSSFQQELKKRITPAAICLPAHLPKLHPNSRVHSRWNRAL